MIQGYGITIPELAEKMGLSRIAIWNKVKKGQIPAVKIGRQYIISEQDANILLGETLTKDQEDWIDSTVSRVVSEYGSVLKKLSHE